MILKVISDGTARGTHLVNEATGERVENVAKIDWRIKGPNGPVEGTITFEFLQVDLKITVPDISTWKDLTP